jgi:pilus assembly protein Flp/PilA
LEFGVTLASLKRFVRDESGASALEYGLLAALIAVVIIVGAKSLGSKTNTSYVNVANKVKAP